MRHEYEQNYARGYVDAICNRLYRDGNTPGHRMTLVVPGCKYSRLGQIAYREGWLDGKASQLT